MIKPGDRIAVYDIEDKYIPHKTTGLCIAVIGFDKVIQFIADYPSKENWFVHVKQCRKLVKKKKK
jgi:hypothetical protein